MQLLELAQNQLHANYQPLCKCLYRNAGCSWTWVWAPFQDYSKPHYDSFEREGLYGASNFSQPFRKWRKLPLHPDLSYFFQREKEFLHVDANQDVLEALTLQDRRPSVCLPSAWPECQMCLG